MTGERGVALLLVKPNSGHPFLDLRVAELGTSGVLPRYRYIARLCSRPMDAGESSVGAPFFAIAGTSSRVS